jgi:hypothetical protein
MDSRVKREMNEKIPLLFRSTTTPTISNNVEDEREREERMGKLVNNG